MPTNFLPRLYQMLSRHYWRFYGDRLPLQKKVMKNNTIRIKFSYTPWGEAATKAKQYYEFLTAIPFFLVVRLDHDVVHIEVDFTKPATTQLQEIVKGLLPFDGKEWAFVGPECPHHKDVPHIPSSRNLVSISKEEAVWKCLDISCRKHNGKVATFPIDMFRALLWKEFQLLILYNPPRYLLPMSRAVGKSTELGMKIMKPETKVGDESLRLEKLEELATAADETYRFFCGLDLQDHPVADQRKFLENLKMLRNALIAAGKGKVN